MAVLDIWRNNMSRKTVFKSAVMGILLAALFFTLASCDYSSLFIRVALIEDVPETGMVGTPVTLTGTVRPVFASNKDIVWSVKNAGTTGADISGNILNANAEGTVTIRARIVNGMAEGKEYTQDFYIVFKHGVPVIKPITSVALNVTGPAKNSAPDTTAAPADVPAHYTAGAVSWSPADNPFRGVTVYTATVMLTAHEGYTFTGLTAAAINGNDANISGNTGTTVTLSHTFAATLDKEITGITIKSQPTKLTYTSGETLDLSGLVVSLTFDSVPPEDAAYDNFNAYNISTIPAQGTPLTMAHNGKPVTILAGGFLIHTNNLTVSAGTVPSVPVTGVTIKPSSIFLTVGGTAKLTAEVQPADATNQAVRWKSDEEGVATVTDDGIVTAHAADTVTITVTTEDGDFTATCTVTVQASGSTSPTEIEMVQIPAGTFTMGSPASEPNRQSDETQHSVTLTKSFYMSTYQVTQVQYRAVMGDGEDRTTTTYGKGDNYPVYSVNWYDAIVFCNKLSMMEGLSPVYSIGGSTDPAVWITNNGGSIPTGSSNETWNTAVMDSSKNGYRLPTEAEWEYACRGDYPNKATETNTQPFGIGDGTKITGSMANFNGRNPYDLASSGEYSVTGGTYLQKTTEVGSYAPNNYGLYDMHGNLYEWCWDWYKADITADNSDPTGAVTGSLRVERGGFWNYNGRSLRSAFRGYSNPNYRSYNVGFRLVRSNVVPVTGVSLDKIIINLTVGGTAVTLTAEVQPANATNKAVTWTSSNTSIATVSNGVVTAVAAGTATITVTTDDGNITASCAVTVAEAEAKISSTKYATLAEAISEAADGTASAPTEIIILQNITAYEGYLISNDKNIKLNVEAGQNITIAANTGDFALFTVTAGSTLTLSGTSGTLTLDGKKATAQDNRRGINVSGGGFTMNSNVTVTGFENSYNVTSGGGGGVYVNGGTFTMNAGKITGNTAIRGGGVHVNTNGGFIMNTGNILGNTATRGGGVYVNGGTFTMNDGEISDNSSSSGSDGGGMYGDGGGVYLNGGTFTMKKGNIESNKAGKDGGGVFVGNTGEFTMEGGGISGNTASTFGGGVSVSNFGNFIMNDGEILNNTASNNSGGGVSNNGTFTMKKGNIESNKAGESGGGVFVDIKGEFTMEGGGISGNTASDWGGGVLVNSQSGNNGIFTMSGGTIYGVNASNISLRNNAAYGGSSIFVHSSGTAKYGNGDNILTTSNTITGHN
jgi:formylglycine-generating enzyme required for sulfatase activity